MRCAWDEGQRGVPDDRYHGRTKRWDDSDVRAELLVLTRCLMSNLRVEPIAYCDECLADTYGLLWCRACGAPRPWCKTCACVGTCACVAPRGVTLEDVGLARIGGINRLAAITEGGGS